MHTWTHLLVTQTSTMTSLSFPSDLNIDSFITSKWTVTADVNEDMLNSFPSAQARRKATNAPSLPPGWSPSNQSALDAVVLPEDLNFSLASSAVPFGVEKTPENEQSLQTFTASFGKTHTGPLAMLNLLAYLPGQRAQYFKYIANFGPAVGGKYGSEAMLLGTGVQEWSSRKEEGLGIAEPEKGGSGVWEDVGLVWYPSIWHFAGMLADEGYAEADRKWKRGVIADNPILCCEEIEL